MTKFSSLTFTTTDLVKAFGGIMFFGSAWYHIVTKMDDQSKQIAELKIYKSADDKVVNSRLDRLELTVNGNSVRMNEFDKWKAMIDATLPERIKIKGK
jgi:hypothetical protein